MGASTSWNPQGLYRPVMGLLTPWSRALLEKLTVNFAASQEIPRIYGIRKPFTVPSSARHLSLSWANSIQSPRPPPQLPEDPPYYYPPIYVLVSPVASFPQASPPTPCAHLYPPPCNGIALPFYCYMNLNDLSSGKHTGRTAATYRGLCGLIRLGVNLSVTAGDVLSIPLPDSLTSTIILNVLLVSNRT
jgi:hypothetical protein